MRYAVIDGGGLVVNIVAIRVGSDWQPPDSCTIVQSDIAAIGDTYNGTSFQRPQTPVVPIPIPTLDQIYDITIQNQQVLKAIVLALNDGSLPIATNKTGAQLKAIIKAKM